MLRWPVMVAGAALLGACAPPASRGGFDSPDPAAKLYAIERAMRRGDRAAVPQLVEQLDSDDPAVRLLAISALERLTGQTYGYRHDDPPWQRQDAIRRWVEAVSAASSPEARQQQNG
jgi:HEAT repeat protein